MDRNTLREEVRKLDAVEAVLDAGEDEMFRIYHDPTLPFAVKEKQIRAVAGEMVARVDEIDPSLVRRRR